ncbi:1-deoxy-D-xylulose-5-phosphate reductoisomerase [Acidihalobacter prosperus]|uniref:1-deoxy-D-xylulose 5-phosphate reductoisomerase n=1 Tax=Acidihalobacter prosperus TaxID=160660 RepID=A0A1A6C912_9GAMM|nr:1-deoxy-D-xylulose-5-phosphate reductoisomerase [Acidihalobacter prosperus]OBS11039.1 1-deoxy-D-xylulose-5-phosphate reductoisomerase [Acidihalobacter prosperus]
MTQAVQRLTILGATGSIGASTLDVVARHPERFRVEALTAHRDSARLFELCLNHRPAYAVMADPAAARDLAQRIQGAGLDTRVLSGPAGLIEVASLPRVDTVMAAIVGAAGLLPTLAAVRTGKRILLANKEALVMAGGLFMAEVAEHQALLLPIDSEHNAVFQCLPTGPHAEGLPARGIDRILLTASGGPFRCCDIETLHTVTPDAACAHPNWSMGRKISVDSATLMNKGLEVIEACWLFDIAPERVDVVVHPQSVIHSLVGYSDGSVLAELGNPDMRTPIAHALAWPERIRSGVGPLDLVSIARLDFEAVDKQRFPCLELAYQAMQAGGAATAILNAANEIAVAAFLDRRMRFTDIPGVIEDTLSALAPGDAEDLDHILEWDARARQSAQRSVDARHRRTQAVS